MKWISNLDLATRITVLVVGVVVAVAVPLGIQSMRVAGELGRDHVDGLRAQSENSSETQLRNLGTSVVTLLDSWARRAEAGELTLEEAQRRAREQVAAIRYGDAGYFWIHSFDGARPDDVRMVMHPTVPRLNGEDLTSYTYGSGDRQGQIVYATRSSRTGEIASMEEEVPFFVEMNRVVAAQGSGIVGYEWPKPTSEGLTEDRPKWSYVQLYGPWGWVVGTGIYVDDIEAVIGKAVAHVNAEVSSARSTMLYWVAGLVVAVLIGMWGFRRWFRGRTMRLLDEFRALAEGDFRNDIVVETHDELGRIAEAAQRIQVASREVADAASEVGSGNLEVAVRPRGDYDRLGHALNGMVGSLRDAAEKQEKMLDEIRSGAAAQEKMVADLRASSEATDRALRQNETMVTELESAAADQQRMLQENAKMVRNLRVLPSPVVEIDRDFNVRFINDAAAGLVGRSAESCVGAKCYDLFKTHECNSSKCAARRAMESGRKVDSQTRAQPRAGQAIPFQYTGLPIVGEDGQVTGALEVFNELSTVYEIVDGLRVISKNLQTSADDLSSRAGEMADATDEMTGESHAVVSSAEQMSVSVSSVAAAIEEMSVSIAEVSKRAGEASMVTTRANEAARGTRERVDQLDEAARRITKVVDVISSIAAQTNQLALNATIEAARAGDAGRGFAVVAEEVKGLARQTTKATQEVAKLIAAIQENATQTVSDIDEIVSVIGNVDDISSSIAAAVEEQTVTTQEIARAVEQAATGAQLVSSSIVSVNTRALQTREGTTVVTGTSRDLAGLALRLDETVGQFTL